MLIAFVANGIGPFGLKILSERGLATQYQAQYLLYWYLGALRVRHGRALAQRPAAVPAARSGWAR